MSIPLIIVLVLLIMSVLSTWLPYGPGPMVLAMWAIAVILLCGVRL